MFDVDLEIDRVFGSVRDLLASEISKRLQPMKQLNPIGRHFFLPRCLQTNSHCGTGDVCYYPTLVRILKANTTKKCIGLYLLTSEPVPSLKEFELKRVINTRSVSVTFCPSDVAVYFSPEQYKALEQFQFEYFCPIVTKGTKRKETAGLLKKYFVAPAKRTEGSWSVDHELIDHVVNKTIPDWIEKELSKLRRPEALRNTDIYQLGDCSRQCSEPCL